MKWVVRRKSFYTKRKKKFLGTQGRLIIDVSKS